MWREHKARCANSKKIRLAQLQVLNPPSPSCWKGTTGRWKRNLNALTIQEALCMSSVNAFGQPINRNVVKFDTDSHRIGIDNRASACISAYIEDFQGPVRKVNRTIKGFGGEHVRDVSMGTIIWKWCDNEGKTDRFTIPNSYYVPSGGVRLLSPQHWAKTQIGAKAKGHKAQEVGETTTATKTGTTTSSATRTPSPTCIQLDPWHIRWNRYLGLLNQHSGIPVQGCFSETRYQRAGGDGHACTLLR
jgi:hypothetical protein